MWYLGFEPNLHLPLPPVWKANTLRRDSDAEKKIKKREGRMDRWRKWAMHARRTGTREKGRQRQTDEFEESPAGRWYFKTKCLTRLAGIHRSVLCAVNLNWGERKWEGRGGEGGGEGGGGSHEVKWVFCLFTCETVKEQSYWWTQYISACDSGFGGRV